MVFISGFFPLICDYYQQEQNNYSKNKIKKKSNYSRLMIMYHLYDEKFY